MAGRFSGQLGAEGPWIVHLPLPHPCSQLQLSHSPLLLCRNVNPGLLYLHVRQEKLKARFLGEIFSSINVSTQSKLCTGASRHCRASHALHNSKDVSFVCVQVRSAPCRKLHTAKPDVCSPVMSGGQIWLVTSVPIPILSIQPQRSGQRNYCPTTQCKPPKIVNSTHGCEKVFTIY